MDRIMDKKTSFIHLILIKIFVWIITIFFYSLLANISITEGYLFIFGSNTFYILADVLYIKNVTNVLINSFGMKGFILAIREFWDNHILITHPAGGAQPPTGGGVDLKKELNLKQV